MDHEEVKAQLFDDKIQEILDSDLVYLYQETVDFILTKYQILRAKIEDETVLLNMLPLLTLPSFQPTKDHPRRQPLKEKISPLLPPEYKKDSNVALLNATENEDDLLIALLGYRHSPFSPKKILPRLRHLTIDDKEPLFDLYFKDTDDCPELEFFTYLFELYLPYQTYDELKQSEFIALLLQDLSPSHGYITPQPVLESDFHMDYIAVIQRIIRAYQIIVKRFPVEAQYLLPRGFLHKVLLHINLNQLQKIKIAEAEDMWDRVRKTHPTLYRGLKKTVL